MIIIYNEIERPYEFTKPKNSELIKLGMKSQYTATRGVVTRQAFLLIPDMESRPPMEKLVNMNKAEIISNAQHKLVFGDIDINPMIWNVVEGDKFKPKNFFFITLKNRLNSRFTIFNDKADYYLLEYAITRDEFTVIVATNSNALNFSMEFVDGERYEYTMTIQDGEVITSKVASANKHSDVLFSLNKFRQAKITKYILCENSDYMVGDPRIWGDIDRYEVIEITPENCSSVVDELINRDVRGITFYGPRTEENKKMRAMIEKRFRLYYETNLNEQVFKKKIV